MSRRIVHRSPAATSKLVAVLLFIACLVIGVAGLILPIIPGLLFLAIAAAIAARHSSWLDRRLRRSATAAGYLDSADGLLRLPPWKRVRLAGLLCLKMLLDGVALAVRGLRRLLQAAGV